MKIPKGPWLTEYEAFTLTWAPFTECAEIPLNREPDIKAWAPFPDEMPPFPNEMPLDRELHMVDKKLQSNIVAPGSSSGPYELCVIHQDAEVDLKSNANSEGLDSWVNAGFELVQPKDVVDDSHARLAWLALKKQGERNAVLDAIMSMIGPKLEPIKEHFLSTRELFVNARNVIPPKFFNLALKGDSKTRRRKIASLFAWFLKSLGIAEHEQTDLRLDVTPGGEMSLQLIDIIRKKSSNTIFIMLLPEEGSFDALFRSKPHWSTFQTTLPVPKFTDRSHEDLRPLVVRTKDAQGISIDPADEEQVIDCLSRQAVKTLTLFDDADNVAKVLQNACEKMKRRIIMNANSEDLQICQEKAEWCWEQAVRQLDEGGSKRRQNLKVPLKSAPPPLAKTCDDPKSSPPRLALTLEDVAGPPVPDLKAENKSWQQLQSMTGLDNVKEEFAQMIDYAQRKKESERLGLEAPRAFSLHRTFLGPPGVGKTTVAKLYGQLILDLGLVSGLDSKSGRHKEPTVVDPSHLIGAYTGWSESRTKSYLSKAQGGVLIIDEAHMLYTSRANGENSSDVFRKAVIDTIVANVTADTDEDRCVILAGYPDHMEDMFLHSNPGLQRRFPKETAMHFEAYTTDQLLQIFSTKLDAEKTKATDEALQVAKQVLTRMRINPQFGNAGDVENLLATARRRNLGRNPQSSWASSPARPLQLEPEDIDPRWDRLLNADGNRAILFEKYVGFEEITDKFERYKNTVVGMKKRGVDPRAKMPWNFIFEGPPGTGKTSTARKLGQLYFDLCLLSTDEVVECSVGDLLDMSGLKVINMLEKGLGKVLFIDEAYRLKGTTAGQLITGELVDAVTKKRYAGNLVIVLAGYTKEMDSLLGTNSGLRSRFSERIRFPTLKSKACKSLLEQELRRNEITIQESPRGAECRLLARGFHRLRGTKAWASGRDVETLARSIANLVFAEEGRNSGGDPSGTLTVSTAEVLRQMRIMYEERASQEVDDAAPRQTRQEDSDAE